VSEIVHHVLVGLGGIGGALAPVLARYLEHRPGPRSRLTLVDGDVFQPPNRERQPFRRLGNKATVTAETLAEQFEGVSIRAVDQYLDPSNVAAAIDENVVVLLGVDNHATRKLVSDHCATLADVTLISGGNDFTDGNVQVYVRRDGRDVTHPLTAYHPEIAHPADHSPAELGCEVLYEAGEPQLLFTNLAIASAMLNAWYRVVEQGRVDYDEVYVDIQAARMLPVRREPADPLSQRQPLASQVRP
jgi:molybdopterin/thiamine biosynthesis adenylyltransferase